MAEKSKVTRITATDDAPKKAAAKQPAPKKAASTKKAKAVTAPVVTADGETKKGVFARIGGYFTGAWYELRQVRWPNRKATWALTVAVILFSLFFLALVLLLDALFKWVFELIIA